MCLIVGMDISGSFLGSKYYNDSIRFLSHYLDAHMRGYGGMEVPETLFIGPIGGSKDNEAKTFFPKQTFEGQSIPKIAKKLKEIFPKNKTNPYSDFNAFFDQAANIIKDRKLLMRPVTILILSDGRPAFGRKPQKTDYEKINVAGLEKLTRNITIRLLYTSAEVGKNWQTKVPRRRVKIWTQDAIVMEQWKEPNIMIPGKPFKEQEKFFKWIKDQVDFGVRSRRVDKKETAK